MAVFKNVNFYNKKLLTHIINYNNIERKPIWGYVAIAFNRVDVDRRRMVGPDRLCAEWIIKNGGAIRTVNEPSRTLKDYNTLPPESVKFKIKVVDATGASIMKIGLDHFKGCEHIDTVIFHQCKHLEDDGLQGLKHLRNSLLRLQVSECDNMNDNSLMTLQELTNLQVLRLFNLRYVNDIENVKMQLSKSLPKCDIVTSLPE